MRIFRFSILLVLVICAVIGPAQTQDRTQSTTTTTPQTDKDSMVARRLKLAREYLIMAGIDAPATISSSELPGLRQALLVWIVNEAPHSSKDVGSQPLSQTASEDRSQAYLQSLLDNKVLTLLRPTVPGRFARMFQIVEKQQQLPSTVVAQLPGASGGPQPVHNPQSYLFSHSIAAKPSELFLSSDDLTSIYKTYGKLLTDEQRPKDLPDLDAHLRECGGDHRFECLARSRKRDLWARFLSGLTLTFGAAQRNQVQQGILFAPQNFPDLDYTFTGQVDFDPTPLFVTSTDWTNAAQSLISLKWSQLAKDELVKVCSAYKKGIAAIQSYDGTGELKIDPPLRKCIDALSRRNGAPAHLWAFLIPSITLKKESQFDFVKGGGGVLIPAPFPQPTLNTFSFTFDLKRLVPSIKERAAALTAFIDAFNGKASTPVVLSAGDTQNQTDERFRAMSDYLELANDPELLADNDFFEKIQAEMKVFIVEHQAALSEHARKDNPRASVAR